MFYIAPPLVRLAEIAKNMTAGVLIESIEAAKEQIQEFQTFEDDETIDHPENAMERPPHLEPVS